MHGVAKNAPNLGTELWAGVEIEKTLEKLLKRPVRVINDADLQGYGVVRGHGVELVLTLGTGLGSALFVGGRLVPNLELGHHPFRRNKTYEAAAQRQAAQAHRARSAGANACCKPSASSSLSSTTTTCTSAAATLRNLRAKLPDNVSVFDNVQGMKGGLHLWQDGLPSAAGPRLPPFRAQEQTRAETRSAVTDQQRRLSTPAGDCGPAGHSEVEPPMALNRRGCVQKSQSDVTASLSAAHG